MGSENFPSCLIHLGDEPPPGYYITCLEQLRFYSDGDIFLLAEILTEYQVTKINSLAIEHHKPSSLKRVRSHEDFLEVNQLNSKFRNGFWKYVVERFYVLEELMITVGIKRVLHLEGDNLIFCNVAELVDVLSPIYSGIAVPFDHDLRAVAGILFIFDIEALNIFNKFSVEMYKNNPGVQLNDMELLGFFRNAFPRYIDSLPVVPRNYPGPFRNELGEESKNPEMFSNNFEKLNLLFDANALGQYIDGVDPRNTNGKCTRKFINETAMHRFDYFNVLYEREINKNALHPLLELNGNRSRIANLHIHSKNLKKYQSPKASNWSFDRLNIDNPKDIPIWEVITQERIQELADICIVDHHTYEFYSSVKFNPRIRSLVVDGERSHLVPSKDQMVEICNARVIFVNTHLLQTFQQHILPSLSGPFVLISHASDDTVDERYHALANDCRLIHWFAQNVTITHDRITPLPIGLANTQFLHGDLHKFEVAIKASVERDKLLFVCLNERTNPNRTIIRQHLTSAGFICTPNNLGYSSYLNDISEHFFVASPRGNGVDCHRTWEALYLGAIPLVDDEAWHPDFDDLRVIRVVDWSKIDTQFLIQQKDSLYLEKYNYRKLRLSFWNALITHKLESSG